MKFHQVKGIGGVSRCSGSPARFGEGRCAAHGRYRGDHCLGEALGVPFQKRFPEDKLEIIGQLGTNGALNAATQGALDMVFSGRPLKPSEREAGLSETPSLETPFVFVSATPEPLRLSRAEVLKIYSGAAFSYPAGDKARLILRPRNDTSTQYLAGFIDGMGAALEAARKRQDIPMAASDQDNMLAARRIPGAFCGMLLTQLKMEPNSLSHVVLDGVAPTLDAMKAGTYTLRQTIYLAHKREMSPAVQRFLSFLASPEASEIFKRAGAVPLVAASQVGALAKP